MKLPRKLLLIGGGVIILTCILLLTFLVPLSIHTGVAVVDPECPSQAAAAENCLCLGYDISTPGSFIPRNTDGDKSFHVLTGGLSKYHAYAGDRQQPKPESSCNFIVVYKLYL
jgi:hypothetical protein